MIFETIQKIISTQLEIDKDKITLESNLTEDLGIDSLDLIDLVMSIEDEFNVEVPDTEFENIKTVGDAVKFIEENQ